MRIDTVMQAAWPCQHSLMGGGRRKTISPGYLGNCLLVVENLSVSDLRLGVYWSDRKEGDNLPSI